MFFRMFVSPSYFLRNRNSQFQICWVKILILRIWKQQEMAKKIYISAGSVLIGALASTGSTFLIDYPKPQPLNVCMHSYIRRQFGMKPSRIKTVGLGILNISQWIRKSTYGSGILQVTHKTNKNEQTNGLQWFTSLNCFPMIIFTSDLRTLLPRTWHGPKERACKPCLIYMCTYITYSIYYIIYNMICV